MASRIMTGCIMKAQAPKPGREKPEGAAGGPPVLLTIAGSDSGGGAGIEADLKTFAALGAYGTAAVTADTAQNPAGISAIQGVEPALVAEQIRQVARAFPIAGAKTGMLLSAAIVNAVADALAEMPRRPPLVVDPVMLATSGAQLLQEDAVAALCGRILPLASLVTPNLDEAARLLGRPLRGRGDMEPAARTLHARLGTAVLVKGGHLEGGEAADCLCSGQAVHWYVHPFVRGVNTHGTGCTLSAAIAVGLGQGWPLAEAVGRARTYLQAALVGAVRAGPDRVLNHAHAPVAVPRS
ncbi:MAG: bifunctional hydroxymethylpyrimidine kinase/phosphomethylpyrimidine kinase [SAR324 cluster bacterium]